MGENPFFAPVRGGMSATVSGRIPRLLDRLSRRRLSMAIAFALHLQRARPEDHGSHRAGAAGDGEVPDDGDAQGCGESNQAHGTHGAPDPESRK